MRLEHEIASIMRFTLRGAGNPHPYYYEVPEDFLVPAMYFPQPEINTRGETFRTYASLYTWYINIICATTEEAHERGLDALTALKMERNLVPMIDTDGNEVGKQLRLNDPALRNVDPGIVQLTLSWTSRRPYYREQIPTADELKFLLTTKDREG